MADTMNAPGGKTGANSQDNLDELLSTVAARAASMLEGLLQLTPATAAHLYRARITAADMPSGPARIIMSAVEDVWDGPDGTSQGDPLHVHVWGRLTATGALKNTATRSYLLELASPDYPLPTWAQVGPRITAYRDAAYRLEVATFGTRLATLAVAAPLEELDSQIRDGVDVLRVTRVRITALGTPMKEVAG